MTGVPCGPTAAKAPRAVGISAPLRNSTRTVSPSLVRDCSNDWAAALHAAKGSAYALLPWNTWNSRFWASGCDRNSVTRRSASVCAAFRLTARVAGSPAGCACMSRLSPAGRLAVSACGWLASASSWRSSRLSKLPSNRSSWPSTRPPSRASIWPSSGAGARLGSGAPVRAADAGTSRAADGATRPANRSEPACRSASPAERSTALTTSPNAAPSNMKRCSRAMGRGRAAARRRRRGVAERVVCAATTGGACWAMPC